MEKKPRKISRNPFEMGAIRKAEEARTRNRLDKIEEMEQDDKHFHFLGRYRWKDSTLDADRGPHHQPMRKSFERILPDQVYTLREYIESAIAEKKGSAIGIEFGGPGGKLFEEFTPGFFERTLGVTLVDHVSEDQGKSNGDSIDEFKGTRTNTATQHTVFEGNILEDSTYRRLEEWLDGRKVDFVIERMAAGLDMLPENPYIAGALLKRWYKLLDEGGLLLAQVPSIYNNALVAWLEKIEMESGRTIDIEFDLIGDSDENDAIKTVLKLHKLTGAPKELPDLSPREIRRARAIEPDHLDSE